MADQDEWSSNANEAIKVSIWQPSEHGGPRPISEFHPDFTYPIFGDNETIFGYRDLKIDIAFAAHDLRPNVSWGYSSKFKAVGGTKATDVVGVLKDFVPKDAFANRQEFMKKLQADDEASFTPPGKITRSYSRNGRQYEIWSGNLTDDRIQALLDRLQVFTSLFIEGGTPLVLDDQEWTTARWHVFFVYERLSAPPTPNASVYSIVGYSTSYRFLTYLPSSSSSEKHKEEFIFPPKEPLSVASLPCRGRISQFLILSPHQHEGHGTRLYNTMVDHFLTDSTCIEITVEDPNEVFDDLRDVCDFARLIQNDSFTRIKLRTDIDPKLTANRAGIKVPTAKLLDKPLLESLRRKHKIASRQFWRLVELYLLSTIPVHSRQAGTARITKRAKATDEGDRAYYYWRLLLKQRIYRQNWDKLMHVDVSEGKDHIEQTATAQADDYERILQAIAEQGEKFSETEDVEPETRSSRAAKRKLIEYDDEEDDDSDVSRKRQG